jgi:CheY-like chemotaxis protein
MMQTKKPKILIIDDEPLNIKILNKTLKEDYEVYFTTKSTQAISLIQTDTPPDLIVLDIIMPEMDGYALCQQIKSTPEIQQIPIIFITAKDDPEEEAYGFELGAVDYIKKPFAPTVVKARVSAHLRPGSPPQTGPKTKESFDILLVEDEIINIRIVMNLLTQLGYTAHPVQTGNEALQAFSLYDFRIVLLDLEMPDMSGFDVAAAIRQGQRNIHLVDIPIIALTAHTDENFRNNCIQHGFNHFIGKPIQTSAIDNVLSQFLHLPSNPSPSSFSLMKDEAESDNLQTFFLTVLHQRIAELNEAFTRMTEEDSSEAEVKIRRIAHSLRGSSSVYGFHEIYQSATTTEDAIGNDFIREAQAFIALLKRIVQSETTLILIIDEDESTKQLLESLFKEEKYLFHFAPTAQEGARILEKEPIALILMNMILPDSDGRSFIRELKQNPEKMQIPLVVLMQTYNEQLKRECLLWGAEFCLTKPLQNTDIHALIPQIVNQKNQTLSRPQVFVDKRDFEKSFKEEAQSKPSSFILLVELTESANLLMRWGALQANHYINQFAERLSTHMGKSLACMKWNAKQILGLLHHGDQQTVQTQFNALMENTQKERFELSSGDRLPYPIRACAIQLRENLLFDEIISALEHGLQQGNTNEIHFLETPNVQAFTAKQRILCVEDDEIIGTFLVQRLSRIGLDVDLKTDGKTALDMIARHDYALIVLDIKLPHMDGYTVLETIRKTHDKATLPVILVTALGNQSDIDHGMELGANDFIQKPFSTFDLINRVAALLNKPPTESNSK